MVSDQDLTFLGKLPVGFSFESGVESMFGLEGSVLAWGHPTWPPPVGAASGLHTQGWSPDPRRWERWVLTTARPHLGPLWTKLSSQSLSRHSGGLESGCGAASCILAGSPRVFSLRSFAHWAPGPVTLRRPHSLGLVCPAARTNTTDLQWVAFPFSRGSSQPRGRTRVSPIAGGFFTRWATREAQYQGRGGLNASSSVSYNSGGQRTAMKAPPGLTFSKGCDGETTAPLFRGFWGLAGSPWLVGASPWPLCLHSSSLNYTTL